MSRKLLTNWNRAKRRRKDSVVLQNRKNAMKKLPIKITSWVKRVEVKSGAVSSKNNEYMYF